VTVTFRAEVVADMGRAPSHVGPKLVPSTDQAQVLDLAREAQSLPALMAPSGMKNKTRFRNLIIAPLLDAGLLEMTVPDKPRSPKQQYRATAAGLAARRATRRA
jgi:ATP-dependent DNA helicase RecG